MKEITIICGPTAVGKTSTSIELAKRLNTEIISSDSMQIYKNMNVGTAKITEDEMQGIKHHMIDIVEPTSEFSVSEYCDASLEIINKLFEEEKIPIVAGGTGLYINSLIYKMDFNGASNNEKMRAKYRQIYEEHGVDYLYGILLQKSPKIAKTIEKNNIQRVIRALEIFDTSDDMRAFECVKEKQNYKVNMYVLKLDREILYDRINKRVDEMIENGLVEEVQQLMKEGLTKEHQSMKAIGYRQVVPYLEGSLSKQDMIELIKRDSRRYAKRQYTWFRRYDFSKWIDVQDKSTKDIADIIMQDLKN